MHKASLKDFLLLIALAAIWGSAFFNIKIASDSFTPMSIAFGRIFFAALVLVLYCWIKGIKIEAFGENWKMYALIIILGPFFYTLGGLFSLKLKHIKNETVTSSILIWAVIIFLPILFIVDNPTELRPSWTSTVSLFYLGVVATAIAWLMRFYILKNNGLVFQSQVAYIIPIFGLIFGYLFLGEKITYKIIVALIAVLISTFLIEKSKKAKIL